MDKKKVVMKTRCGARPRKGIMDFATIQEHSIWELEEWVKDGLIPEEVAKKHIEELKKEKPIYW